MRVRLNWRLKGNRQALQRRRITLLWTLAECWTHRAQLMSSRRTTMGNSINSLTRERRPPRWIWTSTTSHQSWVQGKLVTVSQRWVHSQYRKELRTWSKTTHETRHQKPSLAIDSRKCQAWDLPNKLHLWQIIQRTSLRSKNEKHLKGWPLLRDESHQIKSIDYRLENYYFRIIKGMRERERRHIWFWLN